MSRGEVRGNALFFILIAVALFAALSYAVTQSGRGGGTIHREELSLTTSRIMQFGSELHAAVMKMRLLGTPASAIKLHGNATDVICTAGDTCIFAPEGGGQSVIPLPASIGKDDINLPQYNFAEIGDNYVLPGVNGGQPVLALKVMSLNEETCLDIDKRLGLGSNIPMEGDVLAGNAFAGQEVGCYSGFITGYTVFYVIGY